MNNAVRALSVSLILVLSSLAGCLSDDTEISDKNLEIESFGTVMVSTYHVGELVSAVAGDQVTIDFMSQENIPVHDYEPSASDLIRLQQADIFFYHGLNLEPWVESTLSSLGDDAPPSFMTHAMPTGQTTLDYESILVSDLCELMSDGPFESTTLGMMSVDEHDDHGDDDDDHSDDDDHDDHGDDDDHDDHDDHEGHEHAEAEKLIENPEACPAGTTIQVFHMEVGEHVLEFESEHDEDFNMAALKMLGGHAHHDHDDHSDDNHTDDDHGDDNHTDDGHGDDDHDDHGDEMCHNTETHENYESTEEECEAAGHAWAEEEEHGEEMCHNTETHEDYESTEEECESAGHAWMGHEDHNLPEIHAERIAHTLSFPEDDHNDHDDDDNHTDDDHPEEEWHHEVGSVVIHIEVEGDYGFALPNDVELFVLMDEGGHDGHDDHSDEGDEHDDHSDEGDDHGDEGGEIHADDEEEVFNYDPHSWLSPLAFEAQVNVVLEKLIMTFPDGNTVFTVNAEAYNLQLDALDDGFNAAFGEDGTCAGQVKTIVANHNAYSYMSVQYDIEIISLHGLDPEGEPSPQDIANVVEHINEEGITVLFVEEYTDQTAVDSIVQETGVTIEILYTMEMSPSDTNDDYMSMMNKNLDNLVDGIGC